MTEPTQLVGSIARVVYRNDDSGWTIIRVESAPSPSAYPGQSQRAAHTVAGVFRASPVVGLDYTFTGEWQENAKYGRQFRSEFAGPIEPTSEGGVLSYLRAHARGVGPAVARRIVDAFGASEALRVLREDPSRVAGEVKGLSVDKAAKASEALREIAQLAPAEVAVRGILEGIRVSKRQLGRIMDLYRSEAPEVLRRRPYRLIREVHGIGWGTADAIAGRVGIEADDPERLDAAREHVLSEAENGGGHTYLSADALVVAVAGLCGVEPGIVAARGRGDGIEVGGPVETSPFDVAMGWVVHSQAVEQRAYRAATLRAEQGVAARVAMFARRHSRRVEVAS